MSVFRDVIIPYGGVDVIVTPSNKVLRRIEGKGKRDDPSFNLVELIIRVNSGAGSLYDAAFVLAELINSAGVNTTEDDALAHMQGMDNAAEYRAFLDLLVSCVMPEPKPKKPEAHPEA